MLARLQQHWKVKRLRGISAGPGGNAGFTIDLTYPQMPIEMLAGLSARSAGLYSVNAEQDSTRLLIADIPHNLNSKDNLATVSSITAVCDGDTIGIERKPSVSSEKDVRDAVSKWAIAAHSVLYPNGSS